MGIQTRETDEERFVSTLKSFSGSYKSQGLELSIDGVRSFSNGYRKGLSTDQAQQRSKALPIAELQAVPIPRVEPKALPIAELQAERRRTGQLGSIDSAASCRALDEADDVPSFEVPKLERVISRRVVCRVYRKAKLSTLP